MWCCHGAKDWEERHAANVNHIFIQNASIYLTDRKWDAHMDSVFFDGRHATCQPSLVAENCEEWPALMVAQSWAFFFLIPETNVFAILKFLTLLHEYKG